MEIGKRYSIIDSTQSSGKEKSNVNDFTPVKGKTAGKEAIKEFIKQKDVAAWFRGTSDFHLQGADKLFNALRDDGEQETTHRVRACLQLIGLKPMISAKQIKFLMQLSRGNDLVFLWFLMEMHYKTAKQDLNFYSMNEQLICSAICHLDMITTLRELDKILPSGHTSRIEMKKAGLRRQALKESFEKRKTKRVSSEFVLPYFSKYCRPEHYGKKLFINEPNFKANFNFYSHYKNPNHTVQNESNRWYADYNFNSGKRIVYSVIREIIENIFYNFDAVSLRLKTINVLCDYHATRQMISANLKHELNVANKYKCLRQSFGSKEIEKKAKAQKVIDSLYNAVEEQLRQFKEQTSFGKKNYALKIISSDCKVIGFTVEGNSNILCATNNNSEKIKTSDPTNMFPKKQTESALQENVLRLDGKSSRNYGRERNKNSKSHKDHFGEIQKCNDSNSDCCSVSDKWKVSDKLFKRPTNNKPFKFDYGKIFGPECKEEGHKSLQKTVVAALDQNISSFSGEFDRSSVIYDRAIKKYAQETFDSEVKKYEAEKMNKIEAQEAKCLYPIGQYPYLANYNAENYHLMEQMLSDAFQYLRQNPKFVWAQLPDAHKVPMLREWIAQRFGKEYTPSEKAKSYRRSCIIFRALDKSKVSLPVPNANRIGKSLFLRYGCREHVDKKVQHLRRQFYNRLDSSFFEHTRISWFAMRGYICSKGPPRKSFFAYMPSRPQDVHHFRLWKTSEYRDYRVARNARQCESTE